MESMVGARTRARRRASTRRGTRTATWVQASRHLRKALGTHTTALRDLSITTTVTGPAAPHGFLNLSRPPHSTNLRILYCSTPAASLALATIHRVILSRSHSSPSPPASRHASGRADTRKPQLASRRGATHQSSAAPATPKPQQQGWSTSYQAGSSRCVQSSHVHCTDMLNSTLCWRFDVVRDRMIVVATSTARTRGCSRLGVAPNPGGVSPMARRGL